ncbi:MAG: HU family DNA-binding protein [Clostridiales bacterium]|nr:HU family DNA-binding protein [Clostridiales bacterium]
MIYIKDKGKVYRDELVRRVAKRLNRRKYEVSEEEYYSDRKKYDFRYSQEKVKDVLEAILDETTELLGKGRTIHLQNYIVIEPKQCAERDSFNINTNRMKTIKPRYKFTIRFGKYMQAACDKLTSRLRKRGKNYER